MRTSVVVLFIASTCAAWSWSATGRACAGACDAPKLVLGSTGHVPVGGSVLIECDGCSQSLGDFTAHDAHDAHDSTTASFEGKTRFVAQAAQPTWLNVASPPRYFLWQPKTPLAPGEYRLQAPSGVTFCDERGLAQHFTVVAAVEPAQNLKTELDLSLRDTPSGTTFRCGDSCDPTLASTRSAELPYARIELQLDPADPRFATHLARVRAEYPTGELVGDFLGLHEFLPRTVDALIDRESLGGPLGVVFPTALGRYCVALELMDVVSGSLERTERLCVERVFSALSSGPIDQALACRVLVDATAADYRLAFCRDNAADCQSSADGAACQSWQRQCDVAQPGPDAIDAGAKTPAGDAANTKADSDEDSGPVATDAGVQLRHDAAASTPRDPSTSHGLRVREEPRGSRSACSVSRPAGRSDLPIAFIIGAAAVVVARRRVSRSKP